MNLAIKRNQMTALFVVALGSAVGVSLLTKPTEQPGADSKSAERLPGGSEDDASPAKPKREAARQESESDKNFVVYKHLSPEEAETLRPHEVPLDENIAALGVDALLPDLTCEAPSVETNDAGERGCELPTSRGVPVRVGKWVRKEQDGRLVVGEYRLGRADGVWTTYYPNGRKTLEGKYVDGMREGVWLRWNEEGKPLARRTYENGLLHGPSVEYRGEARVLAWNHGEAATQVELAQ